VGVLVGLAAAIGPLVAVAQAALPASETPNPIDHVVVLMQENRSFDHYFGQLHYQGQPAAEAEPRNASNPNPLGPLFQPVRNFHKTDYCETAGDLDHSWNGSHEEWDGGKMDGFTKANANASDPTGSRTMGWYDQSDLPFYYKLFSTFAIGDRYFQSVLSQTFPNRFYLLAGTSFGHIRNDFPAPDGFTQRTIFNLLDEAGVTWKIYFAQVPFAAEFKYVRDHSAGHVFPIAQYYADAATGNLPQVSFVDPIFVGPTNVENDEHPPSNVQVGEKFTSDVVGALFGSPVWKRSALFLTYDEHGGYYDHVPPPAAVAPDNIKPTLQAGDVNAGFNRLGFRVPVAVISPYARPHFVSHVVNDHTSILRFIEKRFGLPALTKRDAAANPMLEFFDFSRAAFATPPTLPPAPIDPAQAAKCALAPPNTGV
jgi:phospholipase C